MSKKITTIEECFQLKGLDINIMPDVSMLPERFQKAQIALFKLHVAAEVVNDGWEPDYTNLDQTKYQPVFEVNATDEKKSGVGLSYRGYAYWFTASSVGVRLCFEDRDTAKFFGETFKNLYEDLFLVN